MLLSNQGKGYTHSLVHSLALTWSWFAQLLYWLRGREEGKILLHSQIDPRWSNALGFIKTADSINVCCVMLTADSIPSTFCSCRSASLYTSCKLGVAKLWDKTVLTAHTWQKWKRVFLTCPCPKIYRVEAVGLKSCKYSWKITIFVKMWNLGQYRENLKFCQ